MLIMGETLGSAKLYFKLCFLYHKTCGHARNKKQIELNYVD